MIKPSVISEQILADLKQNVDPKIKVYKSSGEANVTPTFSIYSLTKDIEAMSAITALTQKKDMPLETDEFFLEKVEALKANIFSPDTVGQNDAQLIINNIKAVFTTYENKYKQRIASQTSQDILSYINTFIHRNDLEQISDAEDATEKAQEKKACLFIQYHICYLYIHLFFTNQFVTVQPDDAHFKSFSDSAWNNIKKNLRGDDTSLTHGLMQDFLAHGYLTGKLPNAPENKNDLKIYSLSVESAHTLHKNPDWLTYLSKRQSIKPFLNTWLLYSLKTVNALAIIGALINGGLIAFSLMTGYVVLITALVLVTVALVLTLAIRYRKNTFSIKDETPSTILDNFLITAGGKKFLDKLQHKEATLSVLQGYRANKK